MISYDAVKRFCRENRFLRGPFRLMSFIIHSPVTVSVALGRRHYDQRRFDRLFTTTPDPWRYEESAQSDERRRRILELLPRERYTSLLEVGCAEGWLTASLASRADRVTAVDFSRVAIDRAARRCAALANVDFIVRDIITDGLPATHDAIVCAGVLNFSPWRYQAPLRAAIIAALRRGGDLVLEHKRDPSPGEISGTRIHRAFMAEATLELLSHEVRDCYAITVLRRR